MKMLFYNENNEINDDIYDKYGHSNKKATGRWYSQMKEKLFCE
jgi:hypothetical protein